jgi:ribonuclease HI
MSSAKVNSKIDYIIYTDGACKNKTCHTGGWGFVIYGNTTIEQWWGYQYNTTNQRMELLAALKALQYIEKPSIIVLFTDSKYLIKCITEWLPKWRLNGWKTRNKGADVKHRDILEQLDVENSRHIVHWKWVKGHSGDEGNDLADNLANLGVSDGVKDKESKDRLID